jgi:serine/threonine protein kinase
MRSFLHDQNDVINDRYRVVRRLGYGGIAAVYEVEDLRLFTHMALKIVHPENVQGERAREQMTLMMQREARIGAQLRSRAESGGHESLVQVTDVDVSRDHGLPYFVMELLDGHSVRACAELRRGRGEAFAIGDVLTLALGLARGLLLLHSEQLIHCDLKPDNLFLHRGPHGPKLKLLDLGLLAWPENAEPISGIRGTPRYMSPEQCRSEAPRFASDVYSFGVILFELLAGRCPFDTPDARKSSDDLCAAHLSETAPSVRSLRPDVPAALDALVLAMLRKELDSLAPRRPTVREVAERIRALLAEAREVDPYVDEARDRVIQSVTLPDGFSPRELAVMMGVESVPEGGAGERVETPRVASQVLLPMRAACAPTWPEGVRLAEIQPRARLGPDGVHTDPDPQPAFREDPAVDALDFGGRKMWMESPFAHLHVEETSAEPRDPMPSSTLDGTDARSSRARRSTSRARSRLRLGLGAVALATVVAGWFAISQLTDQGLAAAQATHAPLGASPSVARVAGN